MKKINHKLLAMVVVVCVVSLTACKATIVKEKTREKATTKTILVLPFKNMSKIYGEHVNVRCPVCGKVIMIGRVAAGAENDITSKVFDKLKEREGIELIPPSQAKGVLSGLMLHNKAHRHEKDIIIEAGRLLDADAVLYGYVYRYEDRVGTEYAVDSPASVAFDMYLFHTVDGDLLWSGHFDETQQSLFENLFKLGSFIKRRGKWVSADEMATAGIEDVIKTFPVP